jgi:hypothetical protein
LSFVGASQNVEIKRVAVLDDDESQAEITSLCLEEAGFEPVTVRAPKPFTTHEELGAVLAGMNTQASVCDHRLTHRRFSTFNGASHVAFEYDRRFPSILVTQYVDIDSDVSIREHRRKIPVLLSRDSADPETLSMGLQLVVNELNGHLTSQRKPHLAIVRITDLGSESGQEVADAVVPSWNPHRAVRFPLSLIPKQLRPSAVPGARFIAHVNIGAEAAEALYFYGFSPAPEPNPEDGLG